MSEYVVGIIDGFACACLPVKNRATVECMVVVGIATGSRGKSASEDGRRFAILDRIVDDRDSRVVGTGAIATTNRVPTVTQGVVRSASTWRKW